MSLAEFFHMGGYALYVWPAYAIALLVLVLNIVLPILRQRQQLRKLRKQQQWQEPEA